MDTERIKPTTRVRVILPLFIVLLLVSSIGMGCSTTSKTTRSETETMITRPTDPMSASVPPTVTTTVTKETTETETQGEHRGGVLSTVVDVVGEILAFPFRLTGGLIRAIF